MRPNGWSISALSAALLLSVVGCGSTPETSPPGTTRAAQAAAESFSVLVGPKGLAVLHGTTVEPVAGVPPTEVTAAGPVAALLPETSGAAAVSAERIVVLGPGQPPIVKPCNTCSGVAATADAIITTRSNFREGEGFDLVFFDHRLASSRIVPAQRLTERAKTTFPAENTDPPVTLAASASSVTVGYLSRNGGVRAGPSIVAQYSLAGKLLAQVSVDGIIGRSAVSPDGHYLALGVGGSGGACVTVSDLAVIDLEQLTLADLGPAIPDAYPIDPSALSEPWFLLTDLLWNADRVSATGEIYSPPPGESCDPKPQIWQRVYHPVADELSDRQVQARGIRWLGPGCDEVAELRGEWSERQLVKQPEGTELGRFTAVGLGAGPPARCQQSAATGTQTSTP